MTSLGFHRITRPDDACWSDLMGLYEASFKEGEKEARASLESQLCPEGLEATGRPIVLTFSTAADGIQGGIILSYLPAVNSGFISYLMVAPRARGQGLGTTLFHLGHRELDRCARNLGHQALDGVFTELEKESPGEPGTSQRLRFWERLGVLPLAIEWVYPELAPGRRPLDMYLAHGSKRKTSHLTAAAVARVAAEIFRTTYADLPGADVVLARVLKRLEHHPSHKSVPYLRRFSR